MDELLVVLLWVCKDTQHLSKSKQLVLFLRMILRAQHHFGYRWLT